MAESGQRTLCEQVIDAGARFSASLYILVRLVSQLEGSEEWCGDGAPTCAHWVAAALDVEVSTAREWLRIGRALTQLHEIDDAFEQGRISYSKVRTLTRIATVDTQEELLALAERIPAGRLACAIASWRARRESPEETEARQLSARRHDWRVDIDGMICGSYRLPPIDGAELVGNVESRLRRYVPNASADASRSGSPWPSLAQQRADCLMEIVREGGGTVVTEVVVHVRGDGCTLDDGTPISESSVARLVPSSFIRALVHDAERRPLNSSSRRRFPTTRQKRIVKERDLVCVDCGTTELLDFHHEPPFEESQRTVADELECRCASCHHKWHAG